MTDLSPFQIRQIAHESLRRIEASKSTQEQIDDSLLRLRLAQRHIKAAKSDYERQCLTNEALALDSRDRAYWSREILRIRGCHL